MVRISLTLLALSASAFAATTYNGRRGLETRAEPEVFRRSTPVMAFEKRQDQQEDSPEIKKMKDDRRLLSTELDDAHNEVKAARKKTDENIPKEFLDAEEAAAKKEDDIFNGLPQDVQDKVNQADEAIGKQREQEAKAQDQAAPSGSAPAAAPSET